MSKKRYGFRMENDIKEEEKKENEAMEKNDEKTGVAVISKKDKFKAKVEKTKQAFKEHPVKSTGKVLSLAAIGGMAIYGVIKLITGRGGDADEVYVPNLAEQVGDVVENVSDAMSDVGEVVSDVISE